MEDCLAVVLSPRGEWNSCSKKNMFALYVFPTFGLLDMRIHLRDQLHIKRNLRTVIKQQLMFTHVCFSLLFLASNLLLFFHAFNFSP